jgi:hypothetical protein
MKGSATGRHEAPVPGTPAIGERLEAVLLVPSSRAAAERRREIEKD